MKIILTVDSVKPPLTGIGRYTWELATRLGQLPGIEDLRLFDRGRWVAQPEDLLARGGGFVVPLGTFTSRALRAAYRMVAPAWQAWVLRAESEALFHSTNFYLPAYPGRTVVTVHDLSILKFPEFHPPERVTHLKDVIPKVIKRANHLITDSEFTRKELLETFQLPESRVTAIELGVQNEFKPRTTDETREALTRLGVPHGQYLLCVATMEPRKNILGLLEAYRKLDRDLQHRYPLVLAGHKGWNSKQIHGTLAMAVEEGWVQYLGYVSDSDLPHLFSGAAAFVFPSWYEGYGLPVLQAMASGVPCVVSNASSLPEVCEGSAKLFDPADQGALTQSLEVALNDTSWRAHSARRGRELAAKRTWERCAEATANVYCQVCP